MVDIAKATGLGLGLGSGQIYRCFDNKEAIVEAMVRDIIEQRVQHMLLENDNPERKASRLAVTQARIEQDRDNFV